MSPVADRHDEGHPAGVGRCRLTGAGRCGGPPEPGPAAARPPEPDRTAGGTIRPVSRPATRSEFLDRMDTELDALLVRVEQFDAAVQDAPGARLAWSIKT